MSLATIENPRFLIEVRPTTSGVGIDVTDRYSGVSFADSAYMYSAYVESGGGVRRVNGLRSVSVDSSVTDKNDRVIKITGLLGSEQDDPSIEICHVLISPEGEDYFEERIDLSNLSADPVRFKGHRFGFRKRLHAPEQYGGQTSDIENYRLVAVPFRLQPDGKKHDYTLDDLYNGRYELSVSTTPDRVDRFTVDEGMGRSEGWAWTDGDYGLLMIKFNPLMVEYSMIGTESDTDGVHLHFGGAAGCLYEEPSGFRMIEPGQSAGFGATRYHFYEGLWRRGYYMFRDFMAAGGHGLPDDYNPPISWDVRADEAFRGGCRESILSPEILESQAGLARAMGCEMLFMGSGWSAPEGGTTWDDARFGPLSDFAVRMQEQYGLRIGARVVGRSYGDAWGGFYRRDIEGGIGYSGAYSERPFYEPCYCFDRYIEEKISRILDLVDSGVEFLTFDEFDWRGPCFDKSHGHAVPTTIGDHARATGEIIRRVHEQRPNVIVKAHDPVWPASVRYLPTYYMHNPGGAIEEISAFSFLSNPLDDLLSGHALSLFYYKLAYDLPLHMHVNMDKDNDNCLAFWWYASTVRHIGIGGSGQDAARCEAYRKALEEYKSVRRIYSQGNFYGLDELTHIHVHNEEDLCLVSAFNLTDNKVSREVEIRLNDLGLILNMCVDCADHEIVGGKLILRLEIPPFDSVRVRMYASRDE